MREVTIAPISLDRLAEQLAPERAERLRAATPVAHAVLGGRVVWHVNATASGGGVAEMLQTLLAYANGAGVPNRWLVLDGRPAFFTLTKRIHNLLHGSPGDGGPLGAAEREEYDAVLDDNLAHVLPRIGSGDVVVLHDPQTAGLVAGLRAAGAHVIWRCHVGRDTPNEQTELAWSFLRPYVEQADATIFSREAYAPAWVDRATLRIIPPSLDPFSAKNAALTPEQVAATLTRVGLVAGTADTSLLGFERRDGSSGEVRPHTGLQVVGDDPVPADAPLVLQVSRWDRLKDMAGVLTAFADHLDDMAGGAHLALVGPDVYSVSDDPEGAEVLDECVEVWKALPAEAQRRVHLVALPMDDVDENAHIVNALQQHATVVTQKSLVEGFGLTVTEPMWKSRAVVASRVGGIQDQIVHGETGLLLDDPRDLDGFAALVASLLADPERAARLGAAAREMVRDRFLGDRHLVQYVDLFSELLHSPASEAAH